MTQRRMITMLTVASAMAISVYALGADEPSGTPAGTPNGAAEGSQQPRASRYQSRRRSVVTVTPTNERGARRGAGAPGSSGPSQPGPSDPPEGGGEPSGQNPPAPSGAGNVNSPASGSSGGAITGRPRGSLVEGETRRGRRSVVGRVVPIGPSGLVLADDGNGRDVRVQWSDRSQIETGYVMERQQLVAGAWQLTTSAQLPANSTMMLDAADSGAFRYRVAAVGASGQSDPTNWTEIVVRGTGGPAPTPNPSGGEPTPTPNPNPAPNPSPTPNPNPNPNPAPNPTPNPNPNPAPNPTPNPTPNPNPRPTDPSGLRAVDVGNHLQVQLVWVDNSANEIGFIVERQSYAGGVWTASVQMAGLQNQQTLIDSTGVGRFRYRVASMSIGGLSGFTDWVPIEVIGQPTPPPPPPPAPPDAPSSVSVSDNRARGATVFWTDNSNNESGFELERDPAFPDGRRTIVADQTTYTDSAGPGQYSYRVRAVNAVGASAFTVWAPVTVGETPPDAPASVRVTDLGNERDVSVTWTDNSFNETGFELVRETANGPTWGVGSTQTLGANVTSLNDSPGPGLHRYRVRALNGAGGSGYSDWAVMSLVSGWTTFAAAPGELVIHVSVSDGNDQTGDGSEARPYRTFDRVRAALFDAIDQSTYRFRQQTRVLLKRGDVFRDRIFAWNYSGKSAAEPFIISSYGAQSDPRPVISPTDAQQPAIQIATSRLSDIAILHLDLQGRVEGSAQAGIFLGGVGENWLFEGVRIGRFQNGFQVGTDDPAGARNVRIRRCVIADNFSAFGGHSQGILANGINGFIIEESVIDRNGWMPPGVITPTHRGQAPTLFNHGFYLYGQNQNVIVRRNIVSRSSANGISDNCSGVIEDNLVARNPVGIYAICAGTTVRNNAVIEGTDISSDVIRGFGITVGPRWRDQDGAPLGPMLVENNIIASSLARGRNPGIQLGAPNYQEDATTISVRGNLIYNWNSEDLMRVDVTPNRQTWFDDVRFENNALQDIGDSVGMFRHLGQSVDRARFTFVGNRYWSNRPATGGWWVYNTHYSYSQWLTLSGESGSRNDQMRFVDPGRTAATYHGSIGRVNTFEAFIAEAREQRLGNWRSEYAATEVLAHIRDGYRER